MSKEVAPLLYINLCAETVYVIEQRLRAQNISSDKTVSILNDMIGYLFLASRVREMFEPQGTPTLSAAKSLMQSLVNCSVMKVTGDSMSKLCDLAIMAFKFQIMCSSRVDQLLEITRQHLNTIGAILKQHGDTRLGSRVTEVLSLFDNTYSGRTPGELHRMRQCLLQVLQEQRIKVSVLLDLGLQIKESAAFTLPSPWASHVGRVTIYDEADKNGRQEQLQGLDASELAGGRFLDYSVPLGSNLFASPKAPDSKAPDRLVLPGNHVDVHLLAPVRPPDIDGAHFGVVLVD
ncbi:Protein oscp1 [Pleodorina starrii]|uniref:Protein oscp1 n=1 Tax=Pleodorina starrii TaxID=330485 RepID=A0A9W6F7E1_9CHLO|nr:Protein oscp1 [Pleodorina starrii]GLC59083.1 Protein oscp1 [Pleodorina starrii]